MTYVLKVTSLAGQTYATTEELSVRHPMRTEFKRMVGPFREVEADGTIKSRYRIAAADKEAMIANGTKQGPRASTEVDATAAGIKKGVRLARPQELAEVEEIDREIAELQAKIGRLRSERKVAVAEVWKKGNVVRLKEIEAEVQVTIERDRAYREQQEAQLAEEESYR